MTPRLSVSNLAWSAEAHEAALDLLAARGAAGVEVAPTRIAPWDELDEPALAAYRRRVEAGGLVVSSLQAIFYLKPEATLLGDAAGFHAMQEHVRRVGGIAHALGAPVAVFGAPRNRLRGGLGRGDAMQLASERLRRLGDLAGEGGLTLGLEPLPEVYGADFLNHASEVMELVRRSDHPCIATHLDTACAMLAGDDIVRAIETAGAGLAHYHMTEPELGPFGAPRCDHAAALAALRRIDYEGWIAIEMREAGGLEAIGVALDLARGCLPGAPPLDPANGSPSEHRI